MRIDSVLLTVTVLSKLVLMLQSNNTLCMTFDQIAIHFVMTALHHASSFKCGDQLTTILFCAVESQQASIEPQESVITSHFSGIPAASEAAEEQRKPLCGAESITSKDLQSSHASAGNHDHTADRATIADGAVSSGTQSNSRDLGSAGTGILDSSSGRAHDADVPADGNVLPDSTAVPAPTQNAAEGALPLTSANESQPQDPSAASEPQDSAGASRRQDSANGALPGDSAADPLSHNTMGDSSSRDTAAGVLHEIAEQAPVSANFTSSQTGGYTLATGSSFANDASVGDQPETNDSSILRSSNAAVNAATDAADDTSSDASSTVVEDRARTVRGVAHQNAAEDAFNAAQAGKEGAINAATDTAKHTESVNVLKHAAEAAYDVDTLVDELVNDAVAAAKGAQMPPAVVPAGNMSPAVSASAISMIQIAAVDRKTAHAARWKKRRGFFKRLLCCSCPVTK